MVIGTDELVEGELSPTDASVSSDGPTDSPSGSDASDGSTPDSPTEGGSDAPPDVPQDVDAGTFCEQQSPTPTICSDFDVQQLPAGWDTLAGFGSYQGTLDSTDFTSPTRSILFTTPVLADGDQGSRALSKVLATPTTSLTIEFDFKAEVLNGGWSWVIIIDTSNANGTLVSRFRMRESGFDISETADLAGGGTEYSGHAIAGVPDPSKWQHAKWEIDLTGATAFSNVTLDGTVSGGSVALKDYLDNPQLRIGIGFTETPSVAQKLRFDNIVVRAE